MTLASGLRRTRYPRVSPGVGARVRRVRRSWRGVGAKLNPSRLTHGLKGSWFQTVKREVNEFLFLCKWFQIELYHCSEVPRFEFKFAVRYFAAAGGGAGWAIYSHHTKVEPSPNSSGLFYLSPPIDDRINTRFFFNRKWSASKTQAAETCVCEWTPTLCSGAHLA